MDNRIFNVNGKSLQMLVKTLELFVENDGHTYYGPMDEKRKKFEGYTVDPKKGFILIKYGVDEKYGQTKFPAPVSIEIAAGMAMAWLESEDALKVPLEGWDIDCDHDGDNSLGWRVSCENWGHIEANNHTIYAGVLISPAYMWYGK